MQPHAQRAWWISTAALVAGAVLVLAAYLVYAHWRTLEPRFQDDFSRRPYEDPGEAGWEAFGGAWEVSNGTMQNISDDRGAKILNGNPEWRDYIVESDIQLLSETGDAGFVLRTNDEEIGVDAYHGYFAGLRDLDDTLIIGRADFGWHEFRAISVHSRVHTRTWYHLKVIAIGCDIAATAHTPEGEVAVASVHDNDCVGQGRFGLQSYSTGAIWRNVSVRPATEQDLQQMLGGKRPQAPDPPLIDASGLSLHPAITDLQRYERNFAPMQRQLRDNHADLNAISISKLRLLAPNVSQRVTIHGVVTLVSPLLFIQDSSGGISIPNAHTIVPVQIGDAVEANGDAELHSFSSVLRNATVRLLWSHTQVPPVSVTASQAATGRFDAQFVETEGRLASIHHGPASSIILQLEEGSQSFLAIAGSATRPTAVPQLKPGSRLRLRGICVTDKAYTRDEVPFVLLLRSGGDLQVLAPPPWWNRIHIIELGLALLVCLIGTQVLYTSIQRSRLRAVMEERERLAMEMHDTLAQNFAGLGFQLEALCEDTLPETPIRKQLESTLGLARFGHMQAKRNISALRPANLERVGLAAALRETAKAIVRGTQIRIELTTRGELRPIPLLVSDAVFRIAQEAIANAVRHGHPETIRMRVSFTERSVILSVQDDGRGFDLSRDGGGFGIRSMRQRAQRIGANFRLHSAPGRGTIVSVRAKSHRPWIRFLGPVGRKWMSRCVAG